MAGAVHTTTFAAYRVNAASSDSTRVVKYCIVIDMGKLFDSPLLTDVTDVRPVLLSVVYASHSESAWIWH